MPGALPDDWCLPVPWATGRQPLDGQFKLVQHWFVQFRLVQHWFNQSFVMFHITLFGPPGALPDAWRSAGRLALASTLDDRAPAPGCLIQIASTLVRSIQIGSTLVQSIFIQANSAILGPPGALRDAWRLARCLVL